jgi:hypothetical protein
MNGKLYMYVDQYSKTFWATTVRDLRAQVGRHIGCSKPHISKMYIDKKAGGSVDIGYVIGGRWLERFQRIELPA